MQDFFMKRMADYYNIISQQLLGWVESFTDFVQIFVQG